MTLRAVLLLILCIGWWRIPRLSDEHRRFVPAGAAVVIAAVAVLALIATPLVDALDIDAETFRIAAALVLILVGAVRLLGVGAGAEEERPTIVSWVLPVAYPVLIGPETVLAALVVGSDHGIGVALIAGVGGGVLSVAARGVQLASFTRGLVVRAAGVAMIVLAVALLFAGLREI